MKSKVRILRTELFLELAKITRLRIDSLERRIINVFTLEQWIDTEEPDAAGLTVKMLLSLSGVSVKEAVERINPKWANKIEVSEFFGQVMFVGTAEICPCDQCGSEMYEADRDFDDQGRDLYIMECENINCRAKKDVLQEDVPYRYQDFM